MEWPEKRCKQLDELKKLLREVSTINNGNNCLQRIAECIELSDKLQEWSLKRREVSFVAFLEDLARGDEGRK